MYLYNEFHKYIEDMNLFLSNEYDIYFIVWCENLIISPWLCINVKFIKNKMNFLFIIWFTKKHDYFIGGMTSLECYVIRWRKQRNSIKRQKQTKLNAWNMVKRLEWREKMFLFMFSIKFNFIRGELSP